jgi:hypothetical protein
MVDSGSGDSASSTDDPSSDETSASITDQLSSTDDRGDQTTETAESSGSRRDVIVPLAIYKRVTVVSTVLASVLVVLGFLLLDAATKQTRLLRQPIEAGLGWVGLAIGDGTLSTILGLLGLGVIATGAAIYVFGARFRTEGMGSDKTARGEHDDNG